MGKFIITEDEKTQILGLYYTKKFLTEASAHTENLYKSWANKKSGNEELALSIMDDFFSLQKQLPKKDFTLYKTAEELKNDIDKVKTQSKKPEEDADVVYKGNDLLVVATKTWEAGCKYGSGTKWCTSAKDDSSYWFRHNSTGTEFIWIIKGLPQDNPLHKVSLHIKEDMSHDWCNAVNNCNRVEPFKDKNINIPNFEEIFNKCVEYHNKRFEINNKNREEKRKEIMSSPVYIQSVEFLNMMIENIQEGSIIENVINELEHQLSEFMGSLSDDGVDEIMDIIEDVVIKYVKNEENNSNTKYYIEKFIFDEVLRNPNLNFNEIEDDIVSQIIEIIFEETSEIVMDRIEMS